MNIEIGIILIHLESLVDLFGVSLLLAGWMCIATIFIFRFRSTQLIFVLLNFLNE